MVICTLGKVFESACASELLIMQGCPEELDDCGAYASLFLIDCVSDTCS